MNAMAPKTRASPPTRTVVMAFTTSSDRGRLTHIESAPLAATMESSQTHGPQQGAALMKRTTKHGALDVHRATTVASVRQETTGGGAHPVSGHRIDDHFMIGVPFARAVNPLSLS